MGPLREFEATVQLWEGGVLPLRRLMRGSEVAAEGADRQAVDDAD